MRDQGCDMMEERISFAIELVKEMCKKHNLILKDNEVMEQARHIGISLYIARENYNRNKR